MGRTDLTLTFEEKEQCLDQIMTKRNEDDMTITEQCFYILFESMDDRFIIYLLNEVPNMKKYLNMTNMLGWLPVFRVLHLMQHGEAWESTTNSRQTKKYAVANKLL